MKTISIWSEINDDFCEDNFLFIDGYSINEEEGKVIAKINLLNGDVIYLDDRAKTDDFAQEVINDNLSELFLIN